MLLENTVGLLLSIGVVKDFVFLDVGQISVDVTQYPKLVCALVKACDLSAGG